MKISGRKLAIAVASALIATLVLAGESPKPTYKPKEGYVPDEETAIRIAVAVWLPIYGHKTIEDEKPYHAVLSDGVWVVEGSLPRSTPSDVVLGGVAVAEISKDDGRVLRISHSK